MYFGMKSYLKSIRNYTTKQTNNKWQQKFFWMFFKVFFILKNIKIILFLFKKNYF